MKTKSETTNDKSPLPFGGGDGGEADYQEQLDHWTEIVRAVLTAEGNILEQNRPILKDETKTVKQRADIYCRNIAEEVLRATYADRA